MKPLLLSLLLTLSACAAAPRPQNCVIGKPAVETQLYFGLGKKQGSVSTAEWREFARQEIAPRFPEGFSVLDGRGFWLAGDTKRLMAENSKLVIRIHDGSAGDNAAIAAIIADYKRAFEQESVLRVDMPVCAAF